ncbi:hypothetical protein [Frankia sp. CiP3]|uniref:hypothetical protein n=1 Tax=Frankia sp. CiP3 TaxID=2880971 RepID=UPI001EF4A515|nr:hypothetical protein [Frankia sp. CiP3]
MARPWKPPTGRGGCAHPRRGPLALDKGRLLQPLVLPAGDFERRLHGRRRKAKVAFVELPDAVPVQGPESEVLGTLVTNDFLVLLDPRTSRSSCSLPAA